jgi:DNA-binding transcriptional LysR family regulator
MLASQSVLPHAMERMFQQSPGIRVTLHEGKTGPQLVALQAGEVDIALVYGRPNLAGLSVRQLHALGVVALFSRRDPLARRESIRFAELARRPCVLFERAKSPIRYDTIVNAASTAGFVLDIAEVVDDPCATLVMVNSRDPVGFATRTETGPRWRVGGRRRRSRSTGGRAFG